jgi:protein arginine kinase activator
VSGEICPDCGRSWDEIRQRGRLGCAGCWGAFRTELSELLDDLQGADRQVSGTDPLEQARELRRRRLDTRLRSALEREDYAEAGRLRDLMRSGAR